MATLSLKIRTIPLSIRIGDDQWNYELIIALPPRSCISISTCVVNQARIHDGTDTLEQRTKAWLSENHNYIVFGVFLVSTFEYSRELDPSEGEITA